MSLGGPCWCDLLYKPGEKNTSLGVGIAEFWSQTPLFLLCFMTMDDLGLTIYLTSVSLGFLACKLGQ